MDVRKPVAAGRARQHHSLHRKRIVRSAGMYVPSDRCAWHLHSSVCRMQSACSTGQLIAQLWLHAALEGSLQSGRRPSCSAPCSPSALSSEPLHGLSTGMHSPATCPVTCPITHARYGTVLIRPHAPRLRRIVLAQMEGSGRGSLGSYNAQGYVRGCVLLLYSLL